MCSPRRPWRRRSRSPACWVAGRERGQAQWHRSRCSWQGKELASCIRELFCLSVPVHWGAARRNHPVSLPVPSGVLGPSLGINFSSLEFFSAIILHAPHSNRGTFNIVLDQQRQLHCSFQTHGAAAAPAAVPAAAAPLPKSTAPVSAQVRLRRRTRLELRTRRALAAMGLVGSPLTAAVGAEHGGQGFGAVGAPEDSSGCAIHPTGTMQTA